MSCATARSTVADAIATAVAADARIAAYAYPPRPGSDVRFDTVAVGACLWAADMVAVELVVTIGDLSNLEQAFDRGAVVCETVADALPAAVWATPWSVLHLSDPHAQIRYLATVLVEP